MPSSVSLSLNYVAISLAHIHQGINRMKPMTRGNKYWPGTEKTKKLQAAKHVATEAMLTVMPTNTDSLAYT
ncbi:hypothetical protein ACTXT7_003213 [Hymenolepis weldensis]